MMNQEIENLDLTRDLLEKHRIRQILVFIYHPQMNDFVECEYDVIVNILAKYDKKRWKECLPLSIMK